MHQNTHFHAKGELNPRGENTTMADYDTTEVVPEMQSSVSTDYQQLFASGSALKVELGYMFDVYVNGINQTVPTSLVPDTFGGGIIAVATDGHDNSNFGLNGPYLKVAWQF